MTCQQPTYSRKNILSLSAMRIGLDQIALGIDTGQTNEAGVEVVQVGF
jgi:hypothetical protein